MYKFHHNYIKQKYPADQSKLLFTNTYSLTYFIKTRKLYEGMFQDKYLFNFLRNKTASPYFQFILWRKKSNRENKKKGIFKDKEKEEVKKKDGFKKNVVNKETQYQHYKGYLLKNEDFMPTINSMRSQQHTFYIIKKSKTSLCFYNFIMK